MPELLPLTAADCATSTSETTSENQRKSKFAYRASGGQTARIPGITRFSIPVHSGLDVDDKGIVVGEEDVAIQLGKQATPRHRRKPAERSD